MILSSQFDTYRNKSKNKHKLSHEPIPPLTGELTKLIDFDEELVEDPTIASLCRVDTTAQIFEESS